MELIVNLRAQRLLYQHHVENAGLEAVVDRLENFVDLKIRDLDHVQLLRDLQQNRHDDLFHRLVNAIQTLLVSADESIQVRVEELHLSFDLAECQLRQLRDDGYDRILDCLLALQLFRIQLPALLLQLIESYVILVFQDELLNFLLDTLDGA